MIISRLLARLSKIAKWISDILLGRDVIVRLQKRDLLRKQINDTIMKQLSPCIDGITAFLDCRREAIAWVDVLLSDNAVGFVGYIDPNEEELIKQVGQRKICISLPYDVIRSNDPDRTQHFLTTWFTQHKQRLEQATIDQAVMEAEDEVASSKTRILH